MDTVFNPHPQKELFAIDSNRDSDPNDIEVKAEQKRNAQFPIDVIPLPMSTAVTESAYSCQGGRFEYESKSGIGPDPLKESSPESKFH